MNESIKLYTEFLRENSTYESSIDLSTKAKNDLEVAKDGIEKGDYSKVSKIFKNILYKGGKIGLAISILLGILQTGVNIDSLKKSLEKEGVQKDVVEQVVDKVEKSTVHTFSSVEKNRSQLGFELSKSIKELDQDKETYSKTPCYEFTFKYMKLLNPSIPKDVLQDMKMSYDKDVNTMPANELRVLSELSLTKKSPMKDLNWINNKYDLGKIITNPKDIKVGDIINFWIYELIEFSPAEGNYSYPDTEQEFEEYSAGLDINPEDWFIEAPKLVYGHYAVISDIDGEFIYLSSSGEKSGPNGIWNNVPKEETDEFFTKIRISDLSLSDLELEDIKFKRTDDLTNKRSRVPLRVSILQFY